VPSLSHICIQLVQDQLTDLELSQALEDEELVHQLRVLTKRLRAAWHLAQPVCGKKQAQQRRHALRKLSALIAHSRDRSVQSALAEKIHLNHPEISATSLQRLFPSSADTPPPPPLLSSIKEIRQILASEIEAWGNVLLGNQERCVLRHRWRHSFKQTQTLTRQSSKSNDAELWHSWRKAVKRLRYQREFLAQINPRILGKKDLRIRRLGTRLGDHNDLAVFRTHLNSADLERKESNVLNKAVAMEDHKIKRNCRRLGRKLFGK